MFTRSFRAGLAATAVISGLVLTGISPANADPKPANSPPSATDYVGVGSDTTQDAVTYLADGVTIAGSHANGYNDTAASSGHRLASFDACLPPSTGGSFPCTPGGTVVLRQGSTPINRPNGSGAGKGLLYGSGNNEDVTFARSSSGLSTNETNAGLFAYPFALDTLVSAVSGNVASNAPTYLSRGDLLKIYTGRITDWSQVGGKAGVIKPYIPQTGSGTRGFFIAQLTAENNGTAPTLASTVTENQEHDPSLIQGDPNAIAPFSKGRAQLAGTVKIEGGFNADRALYNVVRGTDTAHPEWTVGSPQMEAVFGKSGFVCSTAARQLIEAAGFKQLKNVADGGACGVATSTSTGNLSANGVTSTTTATNVTVDPNPSKYGVTRQAKVTVDSVGSAVAPTGQVTFTIGTFTATGTLAPNGTTAGSSSATFTLPATLPVGTRDATATYNGDGTAAASNGSTSVTIGKASTVTTETFPSLVARGKRAVGAVKVAITPKSTAYAVGSVLVKRGRTIIGRGTLRLGYVRITLSALPRGRNTLVATYGGSTNMNASSRTFTITQQ